MISKVKVFVAVMAIFALVITGTLALQQSIKYRNEIYGEKGSPDITLHDDFDPGVNKKDVYVENTGAVSFYVRVKLDEVMSLVSNARIDDNDPGWIAHIFGGPAEDCGHKNLADKLFHDYFTWTMGGSKYYMPANLAVHAEWPDGKEGSVIQDRVNYKGNEPGVKKTPNAKIITVKDFLAMEDEAQKSFLGWIYDTDGYAYWSQVLRPGEVTGLLLHGVKGAQILSDLNYYYAINVIVEAVDIDDIPMWTEGKESIDKPGVTYDVATADGKEVIYIILNNARDRIVIVDNEACCDECIEEEACECGCEDCPGAGLKLEEIDGTCCDECTEEEDCGCGCEDCPGTETGDGKGKGPGVGTGGGGAGGGAEPGTDESEGEGTGNGTDGGSSEGTGGGSGTGTGGNGTSGGELAVKNPGSTYEPRAGEGAKFTGHGWHKETPDETEVLQEGVFRLEDILADSNYTGLSVTSLEYDGYFTIGTHNGEPAILYNYVPNREEVYELVKAGDPLLPVVTTLRLEQGGKSVNITVVLHYVSYLFASPED